MQQWTTNPCCSLSLQACISFELLWILQWSTAWQRVGQITFWLYHIHITGYVGFRIVQIRFHKIFCISLEKIRCIYSKLLVYIPIQIPIVILESGQLIYNNMISERGRSNWHHVLMISPPLDSFLKVFMSRLFI